MNRPGHLGVSLLLYAPATYFLVLRDLTVVWGLGLLGVVFWSYAPDVDMKLPIPHRGPTHTVLAAVVAGVLTGVAAVYLASLGVGGSGEFVLGSALQAYSAAAVFGFGVGVLGVVSHIVGDWLTPMGVRPFWPFMNGSYSLGLVGAGNRLANQLLSLVGAGVVTAAYVQAIG